MHDPNIIVKGLAEVGIDKAKLEALLIKFERSDIGCKCPEYLDVAFGIFDTKINLHIFNLAERQNVTN